MQNCQARLHHLGQYLRADSVQKVSKVTPEINISDQIFSVYPNIFLLQSKRREPEHVAAVREEETIERGEILCHKLPPHAGPSLHFLRRVQDRTLLCAASTNLLSNTTHTKHALLRSNLTLCVSYLQMCYLQRFYNGAKQSKLCSSGIRWRSFFQFTTS